MFFEGARAARRPSLQLAEYFVWFRSLFPAAMLLPTWKGGRPTDLPHRVDDVRFVPAHHRGGEEADVGRRFEDGQQCFEPRRSGSASLLSTAM